MEEFTLTDEQVDNWRTTLITLSLPPLYMPLGAYAILASRENIVEIAEAMQGIANTLVKEEPKKIAQSDNLIRTRPRPANKRTR